MALSPEQREKRREVTREAAIAFTEDIQHVRDVLKLEELSAAEVRRTSAILRRLLVDQDLVKVAAPRIGKFKLHMPDNTVPAAVPVKHIVFFGSGGVPMFGITIRGYSKLATRESSLGEWGGDDVLEVDLNGFLSSPVICFAGAWISRKAVIKYVANVASGVHSGAPKNADERVLAVVRRVAKFNRPSKERAFLEFNMGLYAGDDPLMEYAPNSIDPVLLEVLAAMHFLVTSSDTARLEAAVKEELS